MRIDPKTLPSPAAGALQRRPAAGRAFAVASEPSPKAAGVAVSAPLSTVDALLAVQGEGDPVERRRRSLKRGHDLLDTLDRLKAALLSNRVAANDLQQLAAQLGQRRDLSGGPGLDEIVAHIELRAKVELAKLGIEP